jgi:DNA-binding response OmpR family regulator
VIETAHPGASVEWMTSGEAAARRMRAGDLDLVISDIFLNGKLTGLDLWEISKVDRFILMSVLTPARLSRLALDLPRPLPSYLQKPLDPNECIETIRALLPA